MLRDRRLRRTLVASLALALVALVSLPVAADDARPRPTTYSYDWYEGAAQFGKALEESRSENRAIAVYFYTDWCGYCRQLERELLERGTVEGYMKYMTKIRINPEDGTDERRIAQHYGVNGFPAFFVHPATDQGPTKIARMTREGSDWRLKTPAEFVDTMRRAVGDTDDAAP